MKGERRQFYTRILLFLFFWFLLSLSLGTSTLAGPVQWLSSLSRYYEWGQRVEDFLVRGLIVFYLIVSTAICVYLFRIYISTPSRSIKTFIVAFILLSGLSSGWLLMNPAHFQQVLKTEISVHSSQFVFGGYPDRERMKWLNREGFTIISLLAPKSILFERILLEQEEELANEMGVKLIRLPILPWVEAFDYASIRDTLVELAAKKGQRYYIHCYLGVDRVNFVRRVLDKIVPGDSPIPVQNDVSYHPYNRNTPRGSIINIHNSIYFYPFTKVKAAKNASVNFNDTIFLVNEDSEIEKKVAIKSSESLPEFVSQHVFNLSDSSFPPERILSLANTIKTDYSRPMIVFSFEPASNVTLGLVNALVTGLPPLSKQMFDATLDLGKVSPIAVNAAIGPTPHSGEFSSVLSPGGIKKAVYVRGETPVQTEERDLKNEEQEAQSAGISWQAIEGGAATWEKLIENGGPWYLYGPGIAPHHLALTESLEGGPVRRLDFQVYLTPLPTSKEIEDYFLNGSIKEVLFLVRKGEEDKWGEQEKIFLNQKDVNFHKVTLTEPYDPQEIVSLALKTWNLPHPIAVILSAPSSYSEAFSQAFFTSVPPLLRSLFPSSLSGNQTHIAAPNIALGPHPSEEELHLLSRAGIRNLLAIYPEGSSFSAEDKESAEKAGLKWSTAIDTIPRILHGLLYFEGPWYIYYHQDYQPLPWLIGYLDDSFGPSQLNRIVYYPETENPAPILHSDNESRTEFYPSGLPDLPAFILLFPPLLLYTLFSGHFVGWLRRKKISVPVTRKIFHLLIFILAGLLQLFAGFQSVVLFGTIVSCAVIYAVYRNANFPFYDALARPNDAPNEEYFIIIPLVMTALGGGLSRLFFGNIYVIGIFVCGLGDSAGELIGGPFGKHKYTVRSLGKHSVSRSIEGSLAVFLVSALSVFTLLSVMGQDTITALMIAFVVALLSTAVEAVSHHGLDNLFLQIVASGTTYYLLRMMN